MNNIKQQQQGKGINLNRAVSMAAGLAVGAGIATGIIVLKDESKRKKIKEVMNTIKDQTSNYLEEKQKEMQTKNEQVDDVIAKGVKTKDEISSVLKDSKDKVQKIIKEEVK